MTNQWKYLSIILMGIIATGVLAPRAFAANPTLEEVLAIVTGIEAKTDALPPDPASETNVNTRASQESVDNIQSTLDALDVTGLATGINSRASQTSVDNLQSDVSAIKSKTDALPADPASNTVVNTRASQTSLDNLQADVDTLEDALADLSSIGGTVKSVRGNIIVNPDEARVGVRNLIPPESGKTFSGHINGRLVIPSGNSAGIECVTPSGNPNQPLGIGATPEGSNNHFNTDFACDSLRLNVFDRADGTNAEGVQIDFVLHYVESSDIVTLS